MSRVFLQRLWADKKRMMAFCLVDGELKLMGRPRKPRHLSCEIRATCFKPQGIPMHALDEIALDLEEIEAIRLVDLDEMYHADAAQKMGVSRATFGNILTRAHKKIAMALLEGKALRIGSAVKESDNVCNDGVKINVLMEK